MESMTRAAELYLEDYYILSEARSELDRYLDRMLEEVYDALSSETERLNDEESEWRIWRNKSSSGIIQLELFIKTPQFEFLRHKKSDIYVQYKDIRQTTRITTPKSVEISTFCTRLDKRLKQELNQRSNELFGLDLIGFRYPAIDTENMDQTVEEVVRVMVESCQRINEIINGFRVNTSG